MNYKKEQIEAVLRPTKDFEFGILEGINRFEKSIGPSCSESYRDQQIAQMMARITGVLYLNQLLPNEKQFTERHMNLFLIKQFLIHYCSSPTRMRTSLKRIGIEGKIIQLLGLKDHQLYVSDLLQFMESTHGEIDPLGFKAYFAECFLENRKRKTIDIARTSIMLQHGDMLYHSMEQWNNKSNQSLIFPYQYHKTYQNAE